MDQSPAEQTLDLIETAGVLRPKDLDVYDIPHQVLYRLRDRGLVTQVGRGLYMLANAEVTENHALVEVCKRVPHGVICLLSALQFHTLGTQAPFQVWLAIDGKSRRPQVDYPPLRVVRFTGRALTEGIEEHEIEGVTVRVYNPAKTVADCFKYRNKTGLDVAIEALRECRRERKATIHDLWYYAKIDRVANVMKPYIEAMT